MNARQAESLAPFSLRPDPRVLYPSAQHAQVYADLLRGLQEGQRLMVLTGLAGSGKTTLLIRLKRELSPHWEIVFLSYTALSFRQLLRFIGDQLNVPADELTESDCLQQLAARFRSNIKGGKRTALFIDEAQSLERNDLDKLSQICAFDADVGLSIVLSGQPALEQALRDRAVQNLKAHIVKHIQLETLHGHDVEAYVSHRLQTDHVEQATIGAKALERVIHYSHGVPRLINIVCGNALRLAAERGCASIGTALVEQGAAMAAIGASPMRGAVPLTRTSPANTPRPQYESTTASRPQPEPNAAATTEGKPATDRASPPEPVRWHLDKVRQCASVSVTTVLRAVRTRRLAALRHQRWTGASCACLLAITLHLVWPTNQDPNAVKAGHRAATQEEVLASTAPGPALLLEPPVVTPTDTDSTVAGITPRSRGRQARNGAQKLTQPAPPRSPDRTTSAPQVEQFQREIAALTRQRDALVASLNALAAQTLNVRRELEASQARVAAATKETELRQGELAELRNEKKELEAQLASLTEASAAQAATIGQLRVKLEGANETIAAQRVKTVPDRKTSHSESTRSDTKFARTYLVRPGDTLTSIATSKGITVSALMKWNGLSDANTIVAGQRLLLRPPRRPMVAAASATPPRAQSDEPARRQRGVTTSLDPLSARLLTAVKRGEPSAVRAALARRAPVNAADTAAKTALMHAADRGRVEIVRTLLRSGAKPNLKDHNGDTALSFAAWSGHSAVVSELLAAGASIDTRNAGGWSPLIYGAINGHETVVAELLTTGAAVDLSNDQDQTALTAAAWNGHVDVVERLLRSGAQVNARSQDNWTPLMHAALSGHTASVTALLAYGASPNLRDRAGDTALILAARNGHLGVVKALVAARADIRVTNLAGESAKTAAIKQGHRQVVGVLKRART